MNAELNQLTDAMTPKTFTATRSSLVRDMPSLMSAVHSSSVLLLIFCLTLKLSDSPL
jgi:hypothetical protein